MGDECAGRIRQRPVHHILEILLIRQLGFNLSDPMRCKIGLIQNAHGHI